MRLLSLAVLVLAAVAVPATAQATEWLLLGTDAEGDDAEAITSNPSGLVIGPIPCPQDCSNIDDVRALSVRTNGDHVEFKVDVTERPEDSFLVQGTYCWLVGFQVQDEADERILLACVDYVDGDGTDNPQETSRGPNILDGYEWDATAATVYLRAPLSAFGGSEGTYLVDIYALSYIGDNLVVDDPAPDAKSNRDAEEDLGSYVIGAASTGAPVIEVTYYAMEGLTVDLLVAPTEPVTEVAQYNWTTTFTTARVSYVASGVNGSVELDVADAAGKTVMKRTIDEDGNETLDVEDLTAGNWTIRLTAMDFQGSLSLKIVDPTMPADDDETTSEGETPGDDTSDDGSDGPTPTGDGLAPVSSTEDKGSPSPGWGVAIAALASLALLRRRRA